MATGVTVRVEVLVFDGCPHADAAMGLAHAVAERLGPGITVERVEVDSPERAAEVGFLGSPSIRVNGRDVEGMTASAGRLCCRTYDGGSGIPSEWLVEAAVLRALPPRGVLFLCVANSARSQLAEGVARFIAPPVVTAWPAGSGPTPILVGGWRHAEVCPTEILVNEPDDAAFVRLAEQCPEVRRASMEEVAAADVVFLALHPLVLASMMPALRPCLSAQAVVVSLAPKIPMSALTAGMGSPRVVRMIPNAPSIIGRGHNPVAFGEGLDAAARQNVSALFAPWGAWPVVPERDLEAYAILTGVGPTYFWFQWQALREVAGQFGLCPERADDALRHMLDGVAATLLQSGLPPAGVMDLIPVRPLASLEESVTAAYGTALPALFAKIRPTA